jgi:hypothetical protein
MGDVPRKGSVDPGSNLDVACKAVRQENEAALSSVVADNVSVLLETDVEGVLKQPSQLAGYCHNLFASHQNLTRIAGFWAHHCILAPLMPSVSHAQVEMCYTGPSSRAQTRWYIPSV